MSLTDLGNPYPLPSATSYTPLVWPCGSFVTLPPPSLPLTRTYVDVVVSRRTRRCFSALEPGQLSALLSLTCCVQKVGPNTLGFPLTQRSVPSAGAIHPIHLILISPGSSEVHRYDSFAHALVKVATSIDAKDVWQAMEEVLAASNATLILLAAEVGMTAAKYGHPYSLIWRDAGALLGYLSMASEALDLSFCPLGVTGEPWIGRLLEQPGLMGVGAAFVGATPL